MVFFSDIKWSPKAIYPFISPLICVKTVDFGKRPREESTQKLTMRLILTI